MKSRRSDMINLVMFGTTQRLPGNYKPGQNAGVETICELCPLNTIQTTEHIIGECPANWPLWNRTRAKVIREIKDATEDADIDIPVGLLSPKYALFQHAI